MIKDNVKKKLLLTTTNNHSTTGCGSLFLMIWCIQLLLQVCVFLVFYNSFKCCSSMCFIKVQNNFMFSVKKCILKQMYLHHKKHINSTIKKDIKDCKDFEVERQHTVSPHMRYIICALTQQSSGRQWGPKSCLPARLHTSEPRPAAGSPAMASCPEGQEIPPWYESEAVSGFVWRRNVGHTQLYQNHIKED